LDSRGLPLRERKLRGGEGEGGREKGKEAGKEGVVSKPWQHCLVVLQTEVMMNHDVLL